MSNQNIAHDYTLPRIHWIKEDGTQIFGAIVPTIEAFIGFSSINGGALDCCFYSSKYGTLRVSKKMLERIIARYEVNNICTKILHIPKFSN